MDRVVSEASVAAIATVASVTIESTVVVVATVAIIAAKAVDAAIAIVAIIDAVASIEVAARISLAVALIAIAAVATSVISSIALRSVVAAKVVTVTGIEASVASVATLGRRPVVTRSVDSCPAVVVVRCALLTGCLVENVDQGRKAVKIMTVAGVLLPTVVGQICRFPRRSNAFFLLFSLFHFAIVVVSCTRAFWCS